MTEQTTRETVTVPRKHIGRLIMTHLDHFNRHHHIEEEAREAVRYILDVAEALPKDGDTATLDAEHVWWLQHCSTAAVVYELDEMADETYEHPAVKAEIEVMFAVADQAPATDRRLTDAFMASLAADRPKP